MKTRAILSLVLTFAGALLVSAATEESFQTNLTVLPAGKLVVDVDFGAIEVSTNASSQVSLDVYRMVSMPTSAKEREFLADRPVVVSKEGNTVTIRARKPGKTSWNWSFGRQSTEGRFRIAVPATFSTVLNTRGGPIHVSDLAATVQADTSGGGLRFSRIQADITGNTSGGGIQLSDCQGTLKVDTSGGGIQSDGGSGSLRANTSGGSITVRNFGGSAHVDTSGGGIRVENVRGTVSGSTSGGSIHASLPSPVPGTVKLSTSGGGIELQVPSTAAFDLDASTSAGGVSCDLPIVTNGKPHHDHLKGPVNGGGPRVELETSAGSVRIRSQAVSLR